MVIRRRVAASGLLARAGVPALAGLGPLALAGLAALALSGCGGAARADVTTPLGPPTPAQAAEVAAINQGLKTDQRAIAAYVAAGPLLSANGQKTVGWFLGQELTHAGVLRSLIKQLGGVAHQPSPRNQLGHPRSAHEVLELLRSVELEQIAAYASAIPRLDKGWLRTRLAAILADDAQHLAVLESMQGQPPPGTAFPVTPGPVIALSDRSRFEQLLRAELIATEVLRLALTSGRLSPNAQQLAGYLLAQERAHVLLLARALGLRSPPQPPRVELDRVVRSTTRGMAPSLLRRQRGWIELLNAVGWRLEGLVYFATMPQLSKSDSLLAASILADEAEHSVLLSELTAQGSAELAVPAALVRGWRDPASSP